MNRQFVYFGKETQKHTHTHTKKKQKKKLKWLNYGGEFFKDEIF